MVSTRIGCLARVWWHWPADLVLALACVFVGVALEVLRPFGLKWEDAASLTGALVGAAAVLLGNSINRANERARGVEAHAERVNSMKAMIVAELVDVACGLLDAKRLIDRYWVSYLHGDTRREVFDTQQFRVRELPFTTSLGSELLHLGQVEVDAIATLRANLTIASESIAEFKMKACDASDIRLVSEALGQTMLNLADAFERIAPERKIRPRSCSDAIPVAVVLKRASAPPSDPRVQQQLGIA